MLQTHEEDALKKCKLHLVLVDADPRFATPNNPNRGRCYLASIALLQYLGGRDNGYGLMRAVDDLDVTHYWVCSPDGEVLDPTADQYQNLPYDPPYPTGKRTGYRGNLRKHLPILNRMLSETP